MKKIIFILLSLLIISCKNDDQINPGTVPKIKDKKTYEVIIEDDITYGKALIYDEENDNVKETELKLDLYRPNNKSKNRPLFMYIHGGGFYEGTKKQKEIVDLAHYYTSRGWVFASIDYRLNEDKTIPKKFDKTIPKKWYNSGKFLKLPMEFFAMYPAVRDAKAGARWLVANAKKYGINTDYITVGGSSAGAITAIALGISDNKFFKEEIDIVDDPTLNTTNYNQSFKVKTIIDLWGSGVALDAHSLVYLKNHHDKNDPPIFIFHKKNDKFVPFEYAEKLVKKYKFLKIPYAFYPIDKEGHEAWEVSFDDKYIDRLSFEFIVEQQKLIVE